MVSAAAAAVITDAETQLQLSLFAFILDGGDQVLQNEMKKFSGNAKKRKLFFMFLFFVLLFSCRF